MIRADKFQVALESLRALLVQAKSMAYERGANEIAALLNDAEMLPEYLADEEDRTAEFHNLLTEIAGMYPGCSHVLDRFEETLPTER